MDILTLIVLGIGLAMDCFAVSLGKGLAVDSHHTPAQWHNPCLMAVLFGLFQGGMPLIGYYACSFFSAFFNAYAGWTALVLLACIGGKMIWEGLKAPKEQPANPDFSLPTLLLLAVATSIDAWATGVLFIPQPDKLWIGICIIALCSFAFSWIGYLIGVFIGTRFRLNANLIGGIILIGIGVKICFFSA